MELSKTVAPLAPYRKHLPVLRELHAYNNTSGPHWPLFSNYLSGANFKETLIPEGGPPGYFTERSDGRRGGAPKTV